MGLERFKEAQQGGYNAAFDEIKGGRKTGHWMWYIFPQLAGMGTTENSQYYAIRDMKEATAYLMDEELSVRLATICKALLALETNDAHEIFGSPDDLKLRVIDDFVRCRAGYLPGIWTGAG
jgi:uncharacterized protein (DUF1810 family)